MTTITIRNPFNRWMYFPTYENMVYVFILETRIYSDNTYDDDKFIRHLEPFEITNICRKVKDELELNLLQWGYQNGECKLWCDKTDINRVYDIANKIVRLDYRLVFNDGSYVLLTRDSYPITVEKHEELFLLLLQKCENAGIETPSNFSLSIHRNDFWTSDQGKLFSERIRQKYLLVDKQDTDYPTISEYWGEIKN